MSTRTRLQIELWSAILAPAGANPNPVVALTVSGLNDVLNSQGLHPGRVLESNPDGGLGFDGRDRPRL